MQSHATVIGDFRTFAVIYVFGIVIYQIFSKTPMDTMAAAASMLLIAPAIGGLAAQYLVWPLAFIIAAGRLRLAVAYAAATSFLLLLYFLIPGSSISPGENIGAFLPLHSLRFLGVPTSALRWAATTSIANDVWLPTLNLYLPAAMCGLAIYLMMSKWRFTSSPESLALNPLELRATRACIPYVAVLIVSVATYSFEPTHVKKELIGVVQRGLTHYAFLRSIYSWTTWQKVTFGPSRRPTRTWWAAHGGDP